MQDSTAIALIQAFGMMSENLQRLHLGDSMTYTEVAFSALAIEAERNLLRAQAQQIQQPVINFGELFKHLNLTEVKANETQ